MASDYGMVDQRLALEMILVNLKKIIIHLLGHDFATHETHLREEILYCEDPGHRRKLMGLLMAYNRFLTKEKIEVTKIHVERKTYLQVAIDADLVPEVEKWNFRLPIGMRGHTLLRPLCKKLVELTPAKDASGPSSSS